jgi:hypothetical protein
MIATPSCSWIAAQSSDQGEAIINSLRSRGVRHDDVRLQCDGRVDRVGWLADVERREVGMPHTFRARERAD